MAPGRASPVSSRRSGRPGGRWRSSCCTGTTASTSKRAVAGLLTFIAAVRPLPVVLLRSDISAVGAVAHQAFAGFVGWSANSRHGPLPMRRPEGDDERDESSSVLVPSFNDYAKTSKLSVFARIRRLDVLRCDDRVCRGDSLLRIADLSDRSPGRPDAGVPAQPGEYRAARDVFSQQQIHETHGGRPATPELGRSPR